MSIFIGSTRITDPQSIALLSQVAAHPNTYGLGTIRQDHGNYHFTPEQVEHFLNPNNPSGNRVDLQDCAQRLAEINSVSSSQIPEATFRRQFAQLATDYRRTNLASSLQVSNEIADTRFFLPLYMATRTSPTVGGVTLAGPLTRIAMARTGLCCGTTPLRSGDFCRDLSLAHPARAPREERTVTISFDHYEIIRGGAMTSIAAASTTINDDARACNASGTEGRNATFILMESSTIQLRPQPAPRQNR